MEITRDQIEKIMKAIKDRKGVLAMQMLKEVRGDYNIKEEGNDGPI